MKRTLLLSAAALALLPACGSGGGGGAAAPGPRPDFSLLDANLNSATTGTNISPRDYLGMAPAWYFGHAT